MLRIFQSVRGLADDSVTRLDKNEDLALEMRDLTELHWGSEFHAVKWRLPATPTSLKSTTFSLGLENFGINPKTIETYSLNRNLLRGIELRGIETYSVLHAAAV